MKRLLRILLPTAIGAISLLATVLPASAGTNGQHITGKNGHAQNLLCLSGYNQNGYFQNDVCTWLNYTSGGQTNQLAPSYWWKTIGSTNVQLDSYHNFPNPRIYDGTTYCWVPESWSSGDQYQCQAR